MRLYVQRNDERLPVRDDKSAHHAGVIFPFMTRAGVPVGFDDRWIEKAPDAERDTYEPAKTGMVVTNVRTDAIYAVVGDGVVVPTGLKLPGALQDGMNTELELSDQEGS